MANNTLKYLRIDPALRAQARERWNQPITWPVIAMLALLALTAFPAARTWWRRERGRRSGA